MEYSPVSNELCTSFHKIGSEIDDIFSSLDIFSSQASENCLKGGSSVDFLGSKESDSVAKESYPVSKSFDPVSKEYCAMSNPSTYRPDLTHTEHCSSNPPTFRASDSDDVRERNHSNSVVPELQLGALGEVVSSPPQAGSSSVDFTKYNGSSTPVQSDIFSTPTKSPLLEFVKYNALSPTKPSVNVTNYNRSFTPVESVRHINESQNLSNKHPQQLPQFNGSRNHPSMQRHEHHTNTDETIHRKFAIPPLVNHSYSSSPLKREASASRLSSYSDLPVKLSKTGNGVHASSTNPPSTAGISREKELCRKHQRDMQECRDSILELTERIQGTIEQRNMLLYKVEASVRMTSAQGVVNEGLPQKVSELNQTLLENDVGINQLQSQIVTLNNQIETSQESQMKLLDRLDFTYSQLEEFKVEKDSLMKDVKQSSDEVQSVLHKYELLQRIHDHCNTIKDNDTNERDVLLNKLDALNKAVSNVNREKKFLVENLSKVYKLVEKLEHKATEKIEALSREMKDLNVRNISLSGSVQEKDAMLSMNKTTIRDLEAKLFECEHDVSDVKRIVEDHENANKEIICAKNKKIKMLSLKVKQVQTRLQSLTSQVGILTETKEKLDEDCRKEISKNNILGEVCAGKEAKITELQNKINELEEVLSLNSAQKVEESNSCQAQLEASISDLVKQKISIQSALVKLEESNHFRLKEIEELKQTLSSKEQGHDTVLVELQNKLSAKDNKIVRLKEAVGQLISSKEDCETQLLETKFSIETLQLQLAGAQEDADTRQGDLLADLKEVSIQLDQYKELVDSLQYSNASKIPGIEGSISNEMHTLQLENRSLSTALQKNRDKNAKLKEDFGKKIREQNEIIDNCVDKMAIENQIAELQAYYEARISDLEHTSI